MEKKEIKLVIFDMAGTAIDEDNLVYKSIVEAFKRNGHAITLDDVLDVAAGKEKLTAIEDLIEEKLNLENKREVASDIYADFKNILDSAYEEHEIRVFPAVAEIITTLKERDIKVAFNTGYNKEVAEKILDKVNIKVGTSIDNLATADMVDNGRPHPEMIEKICHDLNIDPSKAIKVGDSCIDIEEGKNAGVAYSIGITTGAQDRDTLQTSSPDAIIDDMSELMNFIA